jgi:hypothetical protein
MPVERAAHVFSVRHYVHEYIVTVHEGPCVQKRREVLGSEKGAWCERRSTAAALGDRAISAWTSVPTI